MEELFLDLRVQDQAAYYLLFLIYNPSD